MDEHAKDRRRMAIEVTVERMNAERAAIGLGPGVKVGFTKDGVPHLALYDSKAIERVRLTPKPKIERVRLKPKS